MPADPSMPPLPWAATRAGLADALSQIDGALPGSVVVRQMRCGKTACACRTDPQARHGPYIQWTHTITGKRVTRYLSDQQRERYQVWFDNARKLKELIAQLEIASIHAVEATEGWNAQNPTATEES